MLTARFSHFDPLLPSGVPRSIEFTISTLGARHERRQRCAKQDGASRQLIHLKASIRLDVVFARDRPPRPGRPAQTSPAESLSTSRKLAAAIATSAGLSSTAT